MRRYHRRVVGIETGRVANQVRAALFGTFAEPTRIGRYVIEGKLGRGAMGIVYQARDPDLDRKVAVKLVAPSRAKGGEYQERLRREAKAMAKLSHPNIVQVFDAGLHDLEEGSAVYVAMELVEGEDLAHWLRGEHSWRETLAVFMEAGRGLAAAHEAGLVHRDFKPDNVFVEAGGRVRVGDFGLVRSGVPSSEAEAMAAEPPDDPQLTSPEVIVGTPAYMAPEQFDALPADARSDQFSFCVALWQGVYGSLPFAGKTIKELAFAVSSGEPQPPDDHEVPGWLHRTLLRGLRPDPDDRYPTMADLLADLGRDESSRRRRWLLGGAVLVAGALGGWSMLGAPPDPCPVAPDALSDVWGPDQKQALRDAFASDTHAYAEATADAVVRELDAYASAWVTMRQENCRATRVDGSQTDALMDLRTHCLEGRRAELEALVPVLLEGGEQTVRRAVSVTRQLPTLDRCADAEALQAAMPPPDDPDRAAEVEAIRTKLARVRALSGAGQQPAALELAKTLVADAEATEYLPLVTEMHWHLAELYSDLAKFDLAEDHGSRAYWSALEVGYDDMLIRSALVLVHVLGVELRRFEDADKWAKHAEAAVQKQGLGGLSEAALQARIGAVRIRERKFDEAIERLQRSLEITLEIQGPESLEVAHIRGNLSIALRDVGRFEESEQHAQQGLAVTEAQLGPDHPDLIAKLIQLAMGHRASNRNDEARELYERALAISDNAFGPDHRDAGILLLNLGNILREAGEDAAARERYVRARAILEKALGPEHIYVASLQNSIALTLQNEGKLDEARAMYEETLVALRNAEGEDREIAGIAGNNIGNILLDQGKAKEALRYHLESREILIAVRGADDIMVASPNQGLGDAYMMTGKPEQAVTVLEEALRIRALAKDEVEPRIHLVLARALWDSGVDRERAEKIVETHDETLDDLGAGPRDWLVRNEGSLVVP